MPNKIIALVADDDQANHVLINKILQPMNIEMVSAYSGKEALDYVLHHKPDLVLLDVLMSPELTGFDVCRKIKSTPETRFIPTVMVTGLGMTETRVEGLEAGADDYFVKPFEPMELTARIKSLLATKKALDELESAERVIASLAVAIEAKDPYTRGHSMRVSEFAVRLGQAMKLPEKSLRILKLGALLHDVGKIGVSESVLTHPGRLDNEGLLAVRAHPEIGHRMLSPLRSLEEVLPIVRSHHERLDGSGYPDRLSGDEIPLLVRIVSLVDEYDALTTRRPYREALPIAKALEEISRDVASGKLDGYLFRIWSRQGLAL
jgi:putative two-component system response regulator